MTPEIPYRATERQLAFHQSGAKYRLYGGAAGAGKSSALLVEAVWQCMRIPRWTALILRESYNELQQSQIGVFRQWIPTESYKWSERDRQATFVNGSTLRFGYLDNDERVTIYQGDQYGFIGFDELTHFSLYQWSYLTSRNRSLAPGRPNMAGASNPGGRGHAWVKALWVDRKAA
ncbi:MAG: phage terminase large subunit, partial [Planctomycetota bacterium]